MTKKELERKIIKALHKANRAKTLKRKLDKVNTVLEPIQALLAEISCDPHDEAAPFQAELSSQRLRQYSELCSIYKQKFQLDALLDSISREQKKLAKTPDEMTQECFENITRRLHIILDTAPDHPRALDLLDRLHSSFPRFVKNSPVSTLDIDLSPYQQHELSIAIECPLKSITQHETLTGQYHIYLSREHKKGQYAIRLQFSSKQLEDFAVFHEELHTSADYKVFVNGTRMREALFSEWFQCYRRALKARSPQYCYGAGPFTLNVFGCHKLAQPDIDKQLHSCWFYQGELNQESGLFVIAREQIADNIRRQLPACGFCPLLTQEKLRLGMAILPAYINPECDPDWEYLYEENLRIGVVPTGSEIAIVLRSSEGESLHPSAFIEISSSAPARRVLDYTGRQDKRILHKNRYKDITRCLRCGTPYKAHTMICPHCKRDFAKNALSDLDNTLQKLRHTQPITSPQQARKPEETRSGSTLSTTVSFDRLWRDPQIQQILSKDSAEQYSTGSDAAETIQEDTQQERQHSQRITPEQEPFQEHDNIPMSPEGLYEKNVQPAHRSASTGPFALHGKLRGLVSKKYRERKALEDAFSDSDDLTTISTPPQQTQAPPRRFFNTADIPQPPGIQEGGIPTAADSANDSKSGNAEPDMDDALAEAMKRFTLRKKSMLSKRGVVRVIYHATMDKEHCPLCAYLDGMVMEPDEPGTDIFSPPLYPGCTCSREYVLKTEKPSKWPEVNFRFPPKELLSYLQKHSSPRND